MTAPEPTPPRVEQWCVHIVGPDDVLPAEERADAYRQAAAFNAAFVEQASDDDLNDPYSPTVWAVPKPRSEA